ncbi:MAG: SDR family oxidoreductase [Spirirestis rafaelensis WJT71-NPBG6]|jgi:NAD(P)-dependent dehydrogenase (short-subunit alcohol dehydrogenase family)|nr:SDR family oxidoreductase [Spirirestis rafaelensis WJT71-NPBG6]
MTNTVIITGASQGIGKATALEFARQGCNIVLAARQPERLEAAAIEVRELGREALAIPTDVRDPQQVNNLVEKALEHFGHVDVVINNAGIFALGPVEEFQLSDWQQIINTNLLGYIHVIHAILPHLLERGKGTIVNVSSIAGLDAIPYQIPYNTSKHAIAGLTKSLHAELSPKGIQVTGIYPSFIRTQIDERTIFRGKEEETTKARYDLVNTMLHTPLLEKPEKVAKAIWKGVKNQRADVIVGQAKLWTTMYHLFPGLMKPLFRVVFGMKERR